MYLNSYLAPGVRGIKQKKSGSGRFEVQGIIIYFFCFIPLSLGVKLEFFDISKLAY